VDVEDVDSSSWANVFRPLSEMIEFLATVGGHLEVIVSKALKPVSFTMVGLH
jgi:hypothetical protein